MCLAPDTCFGLAAGDTLAATTTAICYQRKLAWIGMVLTDPAERRRGFARQLMEHTLQALADRRIQWIKLDATEMGEPLYRSLGFYEEGPVERWRAMAPESSSKVLPSGADVCLQLDREAFGADRSPLLSTLAPMGAAACPDEGYVMTRPGAQGAYLGPCVCRTTQTARALLAWALARHARRPVYWDLLPDNVAAVQLARASGFQPMRRLMRMARAGFDGAATLAKDDTKVFAIAGFEYG